ncbi:thioesterase [Rhodanobacter sp. FW510-R12]|uniref:YiiD C-terminal domain-containing protein n=1 Tax=unclassified Rhodanobacter TaxID=2621553 RepID=UPI0007A9C5F2|nr:MULTISPECIES: YiiD C-terminal domain-containing protein [unclassified Rhodanobacter]KZC18097.1 thioesterase [Rhodanobacter sp. FW104-R8]KZC28189.1 thioesterase [Rhodanobacter sp. FW510-T8]KZC33447.1 thioesterase [Rhodanobacter sp. FW510-R10]
MSTLDDDATPARQLIAFIRNEIPLAHAMDLQLAGCGDDFLGLRAPLAPNVNDKGCAFGGSLVSLMTLSGWALVELALRRRGLDCDVFVAESAVRYLAPLWRDFHSEARLAAHADWATFFDTLAARGKARIGVDCVVPDDDGRPAATLAARFVAKRRA